VISEDNVPGRIRSCNFRLRRPVIPERSDDWICTLAVSPYETRIHSGDWAGIVGV